MANAGTRYTGTPEDLHPRLSNKQMLNAVLMQAIGHFILSVTIAMANSLKNSKCLLCGQPRNTLEMFVARILNRSGLAATGPAGAAGPKSGPCPSRTRARCRSGPAAEARGDGSAAKTGPAVIAQYLKTLPGSPGVYRMLDAAGTVIYVGKARNLKARVTSYARAGNHSNRITRMIAATAAMEFVTVRTEAEALLLEANLIKRFRPRYNVLLRDDKSFPYILLASDHRAPQILKHRGARNRKGEYFGPFASAGAVNRTINMLERAFLLRSCSDAVFESRTRPCLLLPDQALLGALHRRDRAGRLQRAGRRRRCASCAAKARTCARCISA